MPKPVPIIDCGLCNPEICDAGGGLCAAAKACTHQVVIQEDAFDPPLTIFLSMCVGCANCVEACSLNAIHMNK